MNFKKLGNTDLKVSTICLGTMTWGEQNNQKEAFEQMNYALNCGINFLMPLKFIHHLVEKKRMEEPRKLLEIGLIKIKTEIRLFWHLKLQDLAYHGFVMVDKIFLNKKLKKL